MDLSKLSTEDLIALRDRNYSKVSTEGLKYVKENYKPPAKKEEETKPDTGFTGAVKSGYQNLRGDIAALSGKVGLMDVGEAEKEAKERYARAEKVFKPTEQGWTEAPVQKLKETLGGSLPYMAAPVAAGLGALALPGTAALGTAGAITATAIPSFLQFTGSNLGAQMKGEPEGGVAEKSLKDTDLLYAGAGAIPQTALDVIGLRYVPGVQKIFKSIGKEISEEAAKKMVDQGILKTAGQYIAGGAKVAGIEGATEAGQDWFERLQAGLSLSSPVARERYLDSFIGGAALGGVFSPFNVAGKRSEARDVIQKAETGRQNESLRIQQEEQATKEAELAAKRESPEYRQELINKRNDLQTEMTSLQDILKDKRIDPEDKKEGKAQLKELQKQMRGILTELRTTKPLDTEEVPNENLTIEQIRQEKIEQVRQQQEQLKQQQEQEDALLKQAEDAKQRQNQFLVQHQALANTVDSLQAQLQKTMQDEDMPIDKKMAIASNIGAELDKKNAELQQSLTIAQKAGFDLNTPEAQLKQAEKTLKKAQDKLSNASQDESIVMDPVKRGAVFKEVQDAQAKVAELTKQVEANKAKDAASKTLAEKQALRENADGETEYTGKFGLDKEGKKYIPTANGTLLTNANETLEEPINEKEIALKSESANNALSRTLAGIAGNYTLRKSQFTEDRLKQLSDSIEKGNLTPEEADLLGLPAHTRKDAINKDKNPKGYVNWTFKQRTKVTDSLYESVTDELNAIDEAEALVKEHKVGVPEDPRKHVLESMMQKLISIGYGERKEKPATEIGTALDVKRAVGSETGRTRSLPVVAKLGKLGKKGDTAVYTPTDFKALRGEINKINSMLEEDEELIADTEAEKQRLNSDKNRLKRQLKKKNLTPERRAQINKQITALENDIASIKRPQQLSENQKATAQRRLDRLENTLLDLQLGYKGKGTPLLKLQSQLETQQLREAAAKTPKQKEKINEKIAKLSAQIKELGGFNEYTDTDGKFVEKLASAKGVSTMPKTETEGKKVVPAKQEEEILVEIQDAIDSLRKGEFIGGAAGEEGKGLGINQPRALILKELRENVDKLSKAIVSSINTSRRSQKLEDLTEKEERNVNALVGSFLGTKAARATGWRAAKQRSAGQPKREAAKLDTAIQEAFKAAGFDLTARPTTAKEEYKTLLDKIGASEEEFNGEATETLGKLAKEIDDLEERNSEAVDKLAELKEAKDKNATQHRGAKALAQKQIDNLFKEIKSTKAKIARLAKIESGDATEVENLKKLESELEKYQTQSKKLTTEYTEKASQFVKDVIEQDKIVKGLTQKLREAQAEYRKERGQFNKGEREGKGAIRTGMRDSERGQIRDTLDDVKALFSGLKKPAEYVEPEAKTATKGPEEEKLPKELQDVKEELRALLENIKNREQTLTDLTTSWMSPEQRLAGAAQFQILEGTLRAVDVLREFNEINLLKEHDAAIKTKVTAANNAKKAALANDERGVKRYRDKAKNATAEIDKKIDEYLKALRAVYVEEKNNVDAKLRAEFADEFKLVDADYKKYVEKSKEFQEKLKTYFEQKQAQEGAARAIEEGDTQTRVHKAIKTSQAEAGRKTGLNLYGVKQESITVFGTAEAFATTNMMKKVQPLRKAWKALQEATNNAALPEKGRTASETKTLNEAKQTALEEKQAAFNKLEKETREWGEKHGLGDLTQLYLDLARHEEVTKEAGEIKREIAAILDDHEKQAASFTQTIKRRTAVGPESSTTREEQLKNLQAEQTEETRRRIARIANALTAKEQREELKKREKALENHLAKKRPEDKKKRLEFDNKTIALTADVMVAKNEDFNVLRGRGGVRREAFENRNTIPNIKKEITGQLEIIGRKQKNKETLTEKEQILLKAVGGNVKAYIAERTEAYKNNRKKLTEEYEKNIAAVARLKEKLNAYPGTLEMAVEKEAITPEEAALLKTDADVWLDAYATQYNYQVKTSELKLQAPLDRFEQLTRATGKSAAARNKFLTAEFNTILNELEQEVLGKAKISPEEYKKLLEDRLLPTKDAVFDFEDAGIDRNEFLKIYSNVRESGLDPRIESVHGGVGLSQDQAKAHVGKIKTPKGLKITVLSKLSDTLRGAIAAQGYTEAQINGIRGGVLADGSVFIVAESHADIKDLNRTLAHEITGHLGVEGVLGNDGMIALANKIGKQEGGVMALADKLGVGAEAQAAYNAAKKIGKTEEEARAQAVREMIAHTEETRPDKSFLAKANEFIKALVGAVRAALRKMGVDLSISTSDIYKILRDARKNFDNIAPGAYSRPDGTIMLRSGLAEYGAGGEVIKPAADSILSKEKSLKDKLFPSLAGLRFEQAVVFKGAAAIEAINRASGSSQAAPSLEAMQTKYYINMHEQRYTWSGQSLTRGVPKIKSITRADGKKEFVLDSEKGANIADFAKVLSEAKWGNAEGVRNTYSLYRISKRAKRVGLDKLNFKETEVNAKLLRDVDRIVESNKPLMATFKKADAIYDQYNKDLMNFLVQTGRISKKTADDLTKDNDYIPYYRQLDDGSVVLEMGGHGRFTVGNIRYQPELHELVGGNERIVDVYTGILQNTNMIMNMGLQNLATRNTSYTLANLGLAKTDNEKHTGVKNGFGPDNKNVLRFYEEPKNENDDGKRHIVINSDAVGIPADLIAQGLSGINTSIPAIVKVLGFPSRLLRTWVTRNPVYAARQVVRDPFVAVMAGGVDTSKILSAWGTLGKSLVKSNVAEEIERRGLVSSHVLTGTSEDDKKMLLQLTSGKLGWENVLARADRLAMNADASTRLVAFNNFRKQGLSELEATLATHEMMPFTQRGTSSSLYLLSTMVPFMNAQIQGLNVLYKAFSGKATFQEKLKIRQKLWQRGMLMFGMSMMYAMLMSDDEAYQNATDDEKYNNWFVYVPGLDEPVKVPIPFELGIVFKALPELIINVANNDKTAGEAVEQLTKMIVASSPIGPGSIPTAVKSPFEIMANYSIYTGRDIVDQRLQQVDPQERYNQNTTEIAKLVGGVTGQIPLLGKYLSPVQLEYFVRGYTGSFPLALVSLADPLLRGSEGGEAAEKSISKAPVVGGFFQAKDAGGLINRAYKDMEKMQRVEATYKKLEEDGREKDAEAYLNLHADLIGLATEAGKFRQQMGELTAEERSIRSDPNMNAKEKREALEEIRKEKIELSKELSAIVRE
jgi:hypothetical protein